jgi:hypothetical protein
MSSIHEIILDKILIIIIFHGFKDSFSLFEVVDIQDLFALLP